MKRVFYIAVLIVLYALEYWRGDYRKVKRMRIY
jgi:hypothetical protein